MRVLLANLRHLYQPLQIWTYHVGVAIFVSGMVWIRSGDEAILGRAEIVYALLVTVIIPLSQIVAGMQVYVREHAFAFSLPNHRLAVRRLVFLIGAAVSLIIAMAVPHDGIPAGRFAAVLCSTFFVDLTIFLIGSSVTIAMGWVGLILAVISLFAFICCASYLFPTITYLILDVPETATLLGMFTAAMVWVLLGRPSGRGRDRFVSEVGDSSFLSACRENVSRGSESGGRVCSWIQSRLLHAMSVSSQLSAAKHIQGLLYGELLWMNQVWKWAAVVTLAGVAWAGFGPSWRLFLILLFAGAPGEATCRLIFSQPPILGGRKERFYAAVILLVIRSGLLTAGLSLVVLTMNLLMPLIPDVKVGGIVLRYHPISLQWLMLLMAIWPLVCLIKIWIYRNAIRHAASSLIVLIGAGVWVFSEDGVSLDDMSLAGMIVIVVLSWFICALGTFRLVTRSDLVRR